MRTPLDWLRETLGIASDRNFLVAALARTEQYLHALVAGQRRDFDALAPVLQAKDAEIASLRADLQSVVAGANEAIGQLNTRLTHYEANVPAIVTARRVLIQRLRRENKARVEEQARREALVAAHPALSAEGKSAVMTTGLLPVTAADGHPTVDVERALTLVRETIDPIDDAVAG